MCVTWYYDKGEWWRSRVCVFLCKSMIYLFHWKDTIAPSCYTMGSFWNTVCCWQNCFLRSGLKSDWSCSQFFLFPRLIIQKIIIRSQNNQHCIHWSFAIFKNTELSDITMILLRSVRKKPLHIENLFFKSKRILIQSTGVQNTLYACKFIEKLRGWSTCDLEQSQFFQNVGTTHLQVLLT